MDGEKVTARIKVGLRSAGMLLALSLVMVPVAFVSTSSGQAADNVPASVRYPVGSPGMVAAQAIARENWGVDPCGGAVDISWGPDDPTINARSFWANPKSAYDDPALNVQCRIVLNVSMTFSWEKFCTVLVHEYGHLSGQQHTVDGPDVMSPIYRAPLPACSATPDPWAAAQPAAPAAAQPVTAGPVKVTTSTSPAAKRLSARKAAAAKAKARAKARAKTAKARAKSARAHAASVPLKQFVSADGGSGFEG